MNESQFRFDGRDKQVLNKLEKGQEVHLQQLRTLYRRHTDIRRPRTLRRRIKDLTRYPEFEYVGPNRWLFLGLDG